MKPSDLVTIDDGATSWAKNFLMNHSGTGNNISGTSVS